MNLDKVAALGLPYWLAGGYASPEMLTASHRAGAAGVQVGSAFALCEESGLLGDIKRIAIEHAVAGGLPVRADPRSSPTGFPFKVADLPGTVADGPGLREARPGLRRWLPEVRLPQAGSRGRLPLPGRTGHHVPAQGGRRGRDSRSLLPLQWPDRRHRLRPETTRRHPGATHSDPGAGFLLSSRSCYGLADRAIRRPTLWPICWPLSRTSGGQGRMSVPLPVAVRSC